MLRYKVVRNCDESWCLSVFAICFKFQMYITFLSQIDTFKSLSGFIIIESSSDTRPLVSESVSSSHNETLCDSYKMLVKGPLKLCKVFTILEGAL